MAITTYSELQAAIITWSHRTDLASLAPTFIELTEARINRVFLPRSAETEDALVTVLGSRFVALPSGVINPIGLWINAWTPRTRLVQCLPSELPVDTGSSGVPEMWAIDGERIAFDKLADAAYSFDFRYTKTFALSDANPTNYVLTNNPDLYLWGSLLEVANYTQDMELQSIYESRFQQAMQLAQNNENDTRASAPLMTEVSGMGRSGGFNVMRGY